MTSTHRSHASVSVSLQVVYDQRTPRGVVVPSTPRGPSVRFPPWGIAFGRGRLPSSLLVLLRAPGVPDLHRRSVCSRSVRPDPDVPLSWSPQPGPGAGGPLGCWPSSTRASSQLGLTLVRSPRTHASPSSRGPLRDLRRTLRGRTDVETSRGTRDPRSLGPVPDRHWV